jgi:hypothetical protein
MRRRVSFLGEFIHRLLMRDVQQKSPKPTEHVLKFYFLSHSQHPPIFHRSSSLILLSFDVPFTYFVRGSTFLMNLTTSLSDGFLFVFRNFHLSKFEEHKVVIDLFMLDYLIKKLSDG